MSYEKLAGCCQISSRYLSDIVRKRSAPSILILEKLCHGLGRTPNQLLLPPACCPCPQRRVVRTAQLCIPPFPVCPRCGGPLAEGHLPRCPHCGQLLCWREFDPPEGE